jgi:hypothetical protein
MDYNRLVASGSIRIPTHIPVDMWGYVVRAVDVVWIVKTRVQRGIRGTFHVVQHVPVKDHALHALKTTTTKTPVKIRAKDPDADPGFLGESGKKPPVSEDQNRKKLL